MVRINLLTGEVFDQFEPTSKCDVCGDMFEGYCDLRRHQEAEHPPFVDETMQEAPGTLRSLYYPYMDMRLANEYRRHKSIYKF